MLTPVSTGQTLQPSAHTSWPTRMAAAAGATDASRAVSDQSFVTMLEQFRASGGLASSAEISDLLERSLGRDAGELARWRADCQVVCFEWKNVLWLPRFQFAQPQMLPDPAVCVLLGELRTVFDEGEMAQWCGSPNSALGDRAPVDILNERPLAVFAAAAFDRFIVNG